MDFTKEDIEKAKQMIDRAIQEAIDERNNYSTGHTYGSKSRFEQLKRMSDQYFNQKSKEIK